MWNLKNILRRTNRKPHTARQLRPRNIPREEGYGWKLEQAQPRIPGAGELPITMHTWTAGPQHRGMFEEMNPTQRIPRIEDLPPQRYAAAVGFLEDAFNDVALKCEAAKALLLGGDVNTVLAGLQAYAQKHPVAA